MFQLFLCWQNTVESFHEWNRLFYVHLDATENRRDLVDLLDLFGILGKTLLALSQIMVQCLDDVIHLKSQISDTQKTTAHTIEA